jgi:hypothetical protein
MPKSKHAPSRQRTIERRPNKPGEGRRGNQAVRLREPDAHVQRDSGERRSDRLERSAKLLAEIEGELSRHQTSKTLFEQMQKSALTDLKVELTELNAMLSTDKYRLVFIGQVGVGKTTAICHLVGLTAERKKKRKASKTGQEKMVQVTEDLMATGTGFTTLCEVVVVPDAKNSFTVDPYPPDEVKQTIADFCMATWKKRIHQDSADGVQSTGATEQNFPPELVRAVRNMVKLPLGERRDDDAAIQLARKFPSDGFERFQELVLSRANIDARKDTDFPCPRNKSDPRAWIKKTFDDLNLARLDTVSIPHKITLHVDRKLLSPHMARIAAVVDTKGVDAAQFNRKDLDGYIRQDRDAICILAEGFDTVPTNVTPLLQRHITQEDPLAVSKFALMVLPRGAEPEKVVGQRGPVGDRERGVELRRSQIEDTLSTRGIRGLRTLVFDPLQHFEPAGLDFKLRSDNDLAEVLDDRDDIWNEIYQAIETREGKIGDRVTQISDSLRKIKEGKAINPTEEELVRQTRPKIAEYRHILLANADRFLELYRGLWEGPGARHLMTLRAINNRFGFYPHRNIDIYYDAVPIAEHLVRIVASRYKEAVMQIVRNVRNSAPQDSVLRQLFTVLESRIDTSFEKMVRQVGAKMQAYLHSAFSPQDNTNEFWTGVQGRWGGGPGYRDDVLSMYADKLEGHEEVLAKIADECWKRVVIEPVLEYLRL